MADCSVGMNYLVEVTSHTLRLISSGIVIAKDCNPALTCPKQYVI